MAGADGESWESENFVPAPVLAGEKWADEDQHDVQDDWEALLADDGDAGSSQQVSTESTVEKKVKKKEPKKTKKQESGADNDNDCHELSKKEREAAQINSDISDFAEMLGGSKVQLFSITSKSEFDKLRSNLVTKINCLDHSEHYKDFLQQFVLALCVNPKFDSEFVRDIGKSVAAVATEKAKVEKEAKASKAKSKKKAALNAAKGANDDLDVIDNVGHYPDDDIDDDFM